jgi:hypothetical protein
MSTSFEEVRPRWGVSRARRGVTLPALVPANERSVRRRIAIVWALLVLNAMTFYGSVYIPSKVGQLVTQGALPAALIIALTVNRKVVVRPNVFLTLLSLLAVEAIITTLQPQHVGTLYRTFRFAEFVAALWLITPWWGRRDLLFVRYHLTALSVILGSVILGLVISPHVALEGGSRLGSVLWGTPPTQVAHNAAILMGLVVLLWLSGHMRGRITLIVVAVSGAILLLTHTRTAVLGFGIAILVSGLSLVTVKARALKFFAWAGAIGAIGILGLSSVITSFLVRGENTQELHDLTGRTQVWGPLLAYPRDRFQMIFGFGLSNDSTPVNGRPIDSGWLSAYQTQGLVGVAICAIILIFFLIAAFFHVDRVQRSLALFLVVYDLVSAYTEDGLGQVGMYLMDLVLVATIIMVSLSNKDPTLPTAS